MLGEKIRNNMTSYNSKATKSDTRFEDSQSGDYLLMKGTGDVLVRVQSSNTGYCTVWTYSTVVSPRGFEVVTDIVLLPMEPYEVV